MEACPMTCPMMRTALILLCVFTLPGCNFWRGDQQVGHGPSNYDPYTGPEAERGKPVPIPAVASQRTAERQTELLGQFTAFYQRLIAQEERRASDAAKWLNEFLKDHRNVPPEPALAVVNAHDEAVRQRERLVAKLKTLQEKPLEAKAPDAKGPEEKTAKEKAADEKNQREALEKAVKDATEVVDMFKKYIEEQPIVASAYKQRMDDYKAVQDRNAIWQARLTRVANTNESVRRDKLNADSEITSSVSHLIDHLKIKDDPVRLEVIEMLRSLGAEAKEAIEPLKLLGKEETTSDTVRSAAARTAAALSAQ